MKILGERYLGVGSMVEMIVVVIGGKTACFDPRMLKVNETIRQSSVIRMNENFNLRA